MSEQVMYRLEWEMVGMNYLHFYCNADPRSYANTKQTVANSHIPDNHWHKVIKEYGPVEKDSDETKSMWDQAAKLKEWDELDRDFVRNVKLFEGPATVEWKQVPLS